MESKLARTEQHNLTPIDGGMSAWRQMREEADVLVKSGFFPVDTAEKALAILMQGRELGLGPMQSMRMIDIIKGKPVINAGGMAALVQKYCATHGGYLRVAALDEDYCTIEYKRPEWPEAQRFTFTIDDATAAGLMKNDTWTKYPRNMLYARAISNACRMGWPEVIAGIYDPEELGAIEIEPQGVVTITQGVPGPPGWGEIKDGETLKTAQLSSGNPVDANATTDVERERAMKRYFAILHERGIADDERKALQRIWPGVESAKDMTTEQIAKLTASIERNSNEQLREKIAQNAPDRASEAKPIDMKSDAFDADAATQQLLRDLAAATTQEEVQEIGRSATVMGLHTPEIAKATAQAFLKFRKDGGAIIDVEGGPVE